MTNLRPEHELLVCVARKSLDEGAGDRLRVLLQKDVDWDYLLTSTFAHGLLPLLCTHLNTHGRDLVPPQILERLRSELFSSREDNLYLLRQLLSVLQLFNTNGIRALAFKGPVLGGILYGDVGVRQAGDLDILTARKDFPRAKDLLQSHGYLMTPQLTPAQQASHLRSHCEIQFVHEDQFSVVDLHWGLTPRTFPFLLKPEELFARSEKISLAGREIETFDREDLLLYLCVHGTKHYWTRLEWVAAVAELVRATPGPDWAVVVRRSRETNSERMLCLGLLLASNLFAVELPQDIYEWLDGDKGLRECALRLEEKLFQENRAPLTPTEMFSWNLKVMNRRREAVKSLLRAVLVPTISDWEALTLPAALYPLYYLFRPFRLLSRVQLLEKFR